nr:Uncharacterised protein [Klebsiella pneumoniae]
MTGDAKALDLFCDLCANHMRAQQLAGFSIENRLHKTLCLAAGQRLTIALIRELTDPDGPSARAVDSVRPRLATWGRA